VFVMRDPGNTLAGRLHGTFNIGIDVPEQMIMSAPGFLRLLTRPCGEARK